eukprot:3636536-Pleurochrysis_carterae.AAC.1
MQGADRHSICEGQDAIHILLLWSKTQGVILTQRSDSGHVLNPLSRASQNALRLRKRPVLARRPPLTTQHALSDPCDALKESHFALHNRESKSGKAGESRR